MLKVANGANVAATAISTITLFLSQGCNFILNDCLCVPAAFRNIISILVLVKENYEFSFRNDICDIYFGNKLIATRNLVNDLYILNVTVDKSKQLCVVNNKKPRDNPNPKVLWHH